MRPLCLLLVMAAMTQAAEVKVAGEVKVKPGRLAKITAVSDDAKPIRWLNVHEQADLIESETGRWAVFSCAVPGRYKLGLYSDAGGPPAYCVVVVEGEAPKPPDPRPPLSALGKALRDARDASPGTAAEKATHLAALAALYRQAPAILDKVTTSGELSAALITARKALVPDGALLPVRQIIAAEMAKVLPSDAAAPYGDPARVKALFSALDAALTEANG